MKTLPPQAVGSRTADYCRTHRHIVIPVDHTFDDVMTPSYWTHNAAKLRPGDLLDIVTDDLTFDCQFRVLRTEVGGVYLRPLRTILPKPAAVSETDGFKVEHAGRGKWRVIREADKLEVASGLNSRDDALAWAAANGPGIAA